MGGSFDSRSVVGLIDAALPDKRRQVLGAAVDFDEEAVLEFASSKRQEQIWSQHDAAVHARELSPAVRLSLADQDIEAFIPGGKRAVDNELGHGQGV